MSKELTTAEVLRHAGISPTRQRQHIYDYLKECHYHPSADRVFIDLRESLPNLSKTTVYNTLRLFTQQGLIHELTIEPQESRFDAEMCWHGHFLCRHCGHLYNVPLPSRDLFLDALAFFDMDECEVSFRGCCPLCQQKNQHIGLKGDHNG